VRQHVVEWVGVPAERVRLIANGVDLERFAAPHDQALARAALEIPPDPRAVGIVGRICEQKGQEDFIQAARLVVERHPATVFVVVGAADDAELLKRLHHLAAELGIKERVRFIGYQSDMPTVYAALDVVAAPSRWEGFGLALVEAMAAGRPIVATRVGAIPEVVAEGETALLVPPNDPPALAEALCALLDDRRLAAALGRAGAARAARFSWERAGVQLDELYSSLLV